MSVNQNFDILPCGCVSLPSSRLCRNGHTMTNGVIDTAPCGCTLRFGICCNGHTMSNGVR